MQREALCNDFLDILPQKHLRYALLDFHTGGEAEEDKHRGLAVLTSKLSNRMTQILREVRAEDPGEFCMGVPRFWFAAAQNDLMMLRGTRPKEGKEKPKLHKLPKKEQENTKGKPRK